jgi:FkbM family methyltransferase
MANVTRLAAQGTLALLRVLIGRMPPGSRSWLALQVLEDRYDPRNRAMADFFERCVLAWKNKQYDVARNGEAALLHRLRPFAPTTLLDVGANVGDWAMVARRALPGATVHCFEIAEATASVLAANIAEAGLSDHVVINRIGLGAAEGEIALFFTPESDTESSTLRAAVEYAAKDQALSTILETTARITTGDTYLREHGLTHVDLLKIDVEGAEFSVLEGFADSFASGAIDMVQFEYGPLNLTTRKLLADFDSFLARHGFLLGKIYPEGVAFKPYELADEDFVGPNYLACHQRRGDIIAALRCPPLTTL